MPLELTDYANNIQLQPLYAEETEKAAQDRLYTLVHLSDPTKTINLYLVDNNSSVTYATKEYLPFPLKFNGVNTTTDGSIDKTSITIGNVNRQIMYYVEHNNGLSKWRVVIKFVYEKFLDYLPELDAEGEPVINELADDLAYVEEEFFIDTYSANEQYVQFSLEPIIDLSIQLPRRRFMTDSCFWRFRDPDTCKFVETIGSSISGNAVFASGGLYLDIAVTEGHEVTITDGITTVVTTITSAELENNGIWYACTTEDPTPWDALTISVDITRYTTLDTTGLGPCKKTLAECKRRQNQLNFGAFPGTQSNRRLFL